MKTRAILLISLLSLMVSGEEVIYIKSDSTWRASEIVSQPDWFKPEYDPLSWGYSAGSWKNNPCSKYCGKIKSCEVSCLDWMWYGSSCTNCTRFFKKTIDIPGEIKSASITISGDDAYWLYVNGDFVGLDDRELGYANAETYDISNLLHQGSNVIAIKVGNMHGFEGVVVFGKIEYTSINKIVAQLQAQLKTLESQVNTLTEDKKILQQRADSLESQLESKSKVNENLEKTLGEFRLLNQSLNAELHSLDVSFERCRRTNKTLTVSLIILLITVVVVGDHVHERYIKKKKPTLSSVPIKKEGSKRKRE